PVGGWGQLHNTADGLDPEPIPESVHEHDQLLGPSSSAAKNAEAAFKISLARRSSRFSRSKPLRRSRSSELNPGFRPSSISTRRTHLRTVSAVGPNFSATETIASHCESQCCSASNTIRTARSRSSTGYFPGLFWSVMTPSSQGLEPARYSGRFTSVANSIVDSSDKAESGVAIVWLLSVAFTCF